MIKRSRKDYGFQASGMDLKRGARIHNTIDFKCLIWESSNEYGMNLSSILQIYKYSPRTRN